jgi:hypothetical protein
MGDDEESALLEKWRRIVGSDDIKDKQGWYREAYQYLTTPQVKEHWWCQHTQGGEVRSACAVPDSIWPHGFVDAVLN